MLSGRTFVLKPFKSVFINYNVLSKISLIHGSATDTRAHLPVLSQWQVPGWHPGPVVTPNSIDMPLSSVCEKGPVNVSQY